MMRILCLIICSFAFLAIGASSRANSGDEPTALTVGFKAERTIGGEDVHVYTAEFTAGEKIVANAEQEGIDIGIDVYDPDGKFITRLDSPNGNFGPEPINITASKSGKYRFEIKPLDATEAPGKYLLTVSAFISPEDNAIATAKEAFASADPAVLKLWQDARKDPQAVEAFIKSRKGMGPFIEKNPDNDQEMRITYMFPGDDDTQDVVVHGGPSDAVGGLHLVRIPSTNMFFGSTNIPMDARYSYSFTVRKTHYVGAEHDQFIPETEDVQDPFGKNRISGQFYVEGPDAPSAFAYSLRKSGTPSGKVEPANLKSVILNADRKLNIYTPPGYDGKAPCNLMIEFDAETQGGDKSLVPVSTILDNLIAANKIGPTVCVMVFTNPTRDIDLTCNKPFADFIAQELVPWARSHYSIKPGPQNVVISGSSFGGLDSTYCAFLHPKTIGNVLSMSGSYWITPDWQKHPGRVYPPTGEMIDAFKESKRVPIRFFMAVGLFEPGASMLGSNRELRDILTSKGYDLTYKEFAGNHQPIHWRSALPEGLIVLLGKR